MQLLPQLGLKETVEHSLFAVARYYTCYNARLNLRHIWGSHLSGFFSVMWHGI